MRNAYNGALTAAMPPGPTHWSFVSTTVFPPLYRTKRVPAGPPRHIDINRKPREILEDAADAVEDHRASTARPSTRHTSKDRQAARIPYTPLFVDRNYCGQPYPPTASLYIPLWVIFRVILG